MHLDEHTPLIIGGPEAAREDAEAIVRGKERWTVARLLVDWGGFWGFGLLLALCIGPVSSPYAHNPETKLISERNCYSLNRDYPHFPTPTFRSRAYAPSHPFIPHPIHCRPLPSPYPAEQTRPDPFSHWNTLTPPYRPSGRSPRSATYTRSCSTRSGPE